MSRITYCLLLSLLLLGCNSFLEEKQTGFLTPSEYYTTEDQIKAAVNGTYNGLDDMFATTDLEVATSTAYSIEYLTGYCKRLRTSGFEMNQFLLLEDIDDQNSYLQVWWTATYYNVENCNSVISNLKSNDVVSEMTKNKYLGEVYFLRAYYYFNAVRLFGDIPLKIEPTTGLSDMKIEKSSVEDVYNQIVLDLQQAEQSGLSWTDKSGHVTMGAIKSLLAKVYMTMAGYPLQKGNVYYQKAYEKAKEVIASDEFSLFPTYADLREKNNENTGEFIFMLQRKAETAGNILHFSLLPYPREMISISPNYGGAMAPRTEFIQSYDESDQRVQEQAFFYTRYPEYGDSDKMLEFDLPYIFKYWDAEAEITGRSGANFSILRYADILLLCAEAKSMVDGGSTVDELAVDAYYAVRKRAFPSDEKPSSVSTEQVLKERYWELCFEFQTWFDMLRTRKAFDVVNQQIVNLVGYQAPNHTRAFKESDLIFPKPLKETQLNPNLL